MMNRSFANTHTSQLEWQVSTTQFHFRPSGQKTPISEKWIWGWRPSGTCPKSPHIVPVVNNVVVPEERKPLSDPGRPLATDATAASTSQSLPGFLAKPLGAPVYHGFRVLNDVVVDGFTLGVITDFEAEQTSEGDAFVIAPDDSRAGLVWEVSDGASIAMIQAETDDRWGVWAVRFPFPMTTRENARRNLAAIVPLLRTKWEIWQRRSS